MKQNNSHFVPGRKWSLFLISEVVSDIIAGMTKIIEKNTCIHHKNKMHLFYYINNKQLSLTVGTEYSEKRYLYS